MIETKNLINNQKYIANKKIKRKVLAYYLYRKTIKNKTIIITSLILWALLIFNTMFFKLIENIKISNSIFLIIYNIIIIMLFYAIMLSIRPISIFLIINLLKKVLYKIFYFFWITISNTEEYHIYISPKTYIKIDNESYIVRKKLNTNNLIWETY